MLGSDGTQIGILKQAYQVIFIGLLESLHSIDLEARIGFEVLGDLSDQLHELEFTDQEFSAFLVVMNLMEAPVLGLYLLGFLTPPVTGFFSLI